MTGLQLFQMNQAGPAIVVGVHDGVSSFADVEILDEMRGIAAQVREVKPAAVVVDFKGVEYFGSSMLEALRMLWSEVEQTGGQLILSGLSEVSREIVEISHFDRLWPVFPSRDEALAAVARK